MAESSEPRRFAIAPLPPVRPLAAAAVTTLVGAGLLVLGGVREATAWTVVGAVLLVLGLTLTLLAWTFWRRLRCAVALDATGITVRRGRRTRSLPWSQVAEVTATPMRITVVPKTGRKLTMVNPQPATAPVFAELAAALRNRLDVDRGYRTFN